MLRWYISVGHVQLIDNLIVLLLHSYIWKDMLPFVIDRHVTYLHD